MDTQRFIRSIKHIDKVRENLKDRTETHTKVQRQKQGHRQRHNLLNVNDTLAVGKGTILKPDKQSP